jgi:hypothetical protein
MAVVGIDVSEEYIASIFRETRFGEESDIFFRNFGSY